MADDQNPSGSPFESPTPNGNGDYPPTMDNPSNGLPQGTPNVAARPGKAFAVLGLMGLVVLFLLYQIFSSNGDDADVKPPERTVAPRNDIPPPLPVEPTTPPPLPPVINPPSIPEPIQTPILTPKDDSAEKAQALARMRSAMLLKDGGGILDPSAADTPEAAPTDANSQFAANVNKKVERVKATRIGDLRRTIAQGRIIQATMESALNTDLPAPIRAIVSRDTYAEAGHTPLIPKGSRLIGTYNTKLENGQSRVFVVWTRVIRPDGIDVMIGSPLVDSLGSAGVSGQLDTKFQQMFSRALMSSVMNIATAIGSEKLQSGTTTTTTSTTGTQTSGDAATTATTNALNRLGSLTDSFLQKFIGVQPTILVDQGTPVNVFVNKDLIFPADVSGTQIIN